jgi:hypothetical protein
VSIALPRYTEVDNRFETLTLRLFNFILRHGVWFTPPETYEIWSNGGECFWLAWQIHAVQKELGTKYVEGLALAREPATRFVHHAWNVDRHGQVLDRTWGTGVAYFGTYVTFRRPHGQADVEARTPLAAILG